jgi:hypothetical protein
LRQRQPRCVRGADEARAAVTDVPTDDGLCAATSVRMAGQRRRTACTATGCRDGAEPRTAEHLTPPSATVCGAGAAALHAAGRRRRQRCRRR